MNVTGVVVGSIGDLQPFIALGKELRNRGYQVRLLTFEAFRSKVEKDGLEFCLLHGDPEEMMRKMLSEEQEGPGVLRSIRELLGKYPQIYQDIHHACIHSDLIIYMQFGALAYHFAEKWNIPCVRTFAIPYDPTKLYSPFFPYIKRNTVRCKCSYKLCEIMMNWAAKPTIDMWRTQLGLNQWNLFRTYRRMKGQAILTLYQFSPSIIPRDPTWKSHIYVTGEWNEKVDGTAQINQKLQKFMEWGDEPIYIGFGSMVSKKIIELQEVFIKVLKRTGRRAVFVSSWEKFDERLQCDHIFYTDFVPFEWLFQRVKAVVHHGGAGTMALALRAEKPNLVIGFGVDQVFRGKQIHEMGAGPEPIDLTKTELSEELIESRMEELISGKYLEGSKRISASMKAEDGCRMACDIIEKQLLKGGVARR